jgi:hypothetical protein
MVHFTLYAVMDTLSGWASFMAMANPLLNAGIIIFSSIVYLIFEFKIFYYFLVIYFFFVPKYKAALRQQWKMVTRCSNSGSLDHTGYFLSIFKIFIFLILIKLYLNI